MRRPLASSRIIYEYCPVLCHEQSRRRRACHESCSPLIVTTRAICPFCWSAGAERAQAMVSLVCLLAFVLFFGLGSGPIPWIYLPEVLPNEIKGCGASLGTCINWVSTFLVGLSFPVMLRVFGVGGSYLVYAIFNFGALAFAYVYMVETKQQSLAQIQKLLLLEE